MGTCYVGSLLAVVSALMCKVTMLKVASGKGKGRLVRDGVHMAFSCSRESVVGWRKGVICVGISADAHHSCLGIVPLIPSTLSVLRAAKLSWWPCQPCIPLPAWSNKCGCISEGDRARQGGLFSNREF